MRSPRRTRIIVASALVAFSVPACADSEPAETEGATRTVPSLFGDVDIPVEPKRIVALSEHILATALLVDAPVVGTESPEFGDAYPSFIDEDSTGGIESRVGTSSELNIEEIVELEPDLIIGDDDFVEEPYDQLRTIAPTVAMDIGGSQPWKEQVRDIAAILDREAAADEAIAEFEARIADFRAEVTPNVEDLGFSLVNFRALDDIRIYTSEWCSSQILSEAGLTRPESHSPPGEESIQLGIERLLEVDADVLFYFVGSSGTNPDEAQEAANQVQDHPLWDELGAVQNDRAYQVDSEWWFTCGSVQAANLVLDDLFELLGSPA